MDAALGLEGVVFLIPQIRSLSDLTQFYLRLAALYFLVLILVAVVFQALGVLCVWLSETIPAAIKINNIDRKATLEVKDEKVIDRLFAPLQIINNEHSELTSCYAVLKKLRRVGAKYYFSRLDRGPKLLKSKTKGEDCEISIGAHGGEPYYRFTKWQ